MRVAIDSSAAYTARAGVHRYVRGLLAGLRAMETDAPEIQELAWAVANYGYAQPARALKTTFRELVWAPLVAPRLLARGGFDLFHSPASWFVTPPKEMPHVVTLHDLAVLRQSDRFRRWHRATAQHRLAQLHRATRIIAVSAFTAREAVELLGIDPSRIEVIHHGPGLCGIPGAGIAESDPNLKLAGEFLLFVGSLEPGKNLRLLREMYDMSSSAGAALPPLVVAGTRWRGVGTEGPPPAGWVFLSGPEDAHLAWLYRRAAALLFPSTYEGFGFPVLEAMSLGCPVVCSRVASLPEIGGDAPIYAQASPATYLEAINHLLSHPGRRLELSERGFERARRFSWERCSSETLAVYQAAARSVPKPAAKSP